MTLAEPSSTATPPTGLIDLRAHQARSNDMWPVHVFRAAELADGMKALEIGEPGPDGRRELNVVHPSSTEPGLGLSPGIDAILGVLLPGERTVPLRHNASSFGMCLSGRGRTTIGDAVFELGPRDCWITPSMTPHVLQNTGADALTYVVYSNRPWLQKLEIYYVEFEPAVPASGASPGRGAVERMKDLAPGFAIGDGTSWLLPYEHLIDPEYVECAPLKWAWDDVAPHLGMLKGLGRDYTGRPLFCLYNPATGTRNGTTFNFFATISNGIGDRVGPSHRHTSAAINFILEGSGSSVVDGTRVEWEAGDIMLSAPGWAVHAHSRGPEGAVILTIQDHPLLIGADALVWQEDVKNGPILSIGHQQGFETNLSKFLSQD